MYVAAGIVVFSYFILFIISSGEEADGEEKGFMLPFYKAGIFIYKKASVLDFKLFGNMSVIRDLETLNSGISSKKLSRKYYSGKIARFLAICLVGTLFGSLVSFKSREEMALNGDNTITRGLYDETAREVQLELLNDENKIFRLKINPRKLSVEEADSLYGTFSEQLKTVMLDKNSSPGEVRYNLNLAESLSGYPFLVEWKSENQELVSDTGKIAIVEACETVKIMATVSYEDMSWTNEYELVIVPPQISESEKKYLELQNMLDAAESDSRGREFVQLPAKYNGENIFWRQKIDDHSLLVWVISIALAILVFFLSDKDLHLEIENRKMIMRKEYPEIVQKLVLYMGAGMTIRNAFQKIALDYERENRAKKLIYPAHEEVLYTYRELMAGVSEKDAYEHFGKRTGLQEYIRLSGFLQQNLKKGNASIIERLREEIDKSTLEILQRSRRLGEEASTKLIVPMVMMLLVVMVIIMIPAFSFSEI